MTGVRKGGRILENWGVRRGEGPRGLRFHGVRSLMEKLTRVITSSMGGGGGTHSASGIRRAVWGDGWGIDYSI